MQSTATTHNLSVSIHREATEAYAFLAKPENFPRWATGLGTLRITSQGWIADTPEGQVAVRFSQSNPFGVLDHWVTLTDGTTIYIPMRVVQNGNGCELIFTLFRQPGMTDEKFWADAEWVMRDLTAAKALLEQDTD